MNNKVCHYKERALEAHENLFCSTEINYDTLHCKADTALERKKSFITTHWSAE
jgi:hypothetical protein